MSSERVEVVRRSDGAFVEAELLDGVRPEDLALVERAWGPTRLEIYEALLKAGVPRARWPESLHWDWTKKAPDLKLLAASGFGIVCEKKWQGLLLAKTAGHQAALSPDKGKPLVYVDYIETAPWNWRIEAIAQEGEWQAVGSLLFRKAVVLSLDEGFRGRLGLHALPQAERYYTEACGMTAVGRDSSKQNLMYFEYTAEQATRFLDGKGGNA